MHYFLNYYPNNLSKKSGIQKSRKIKDILGLQENTLFSNVSDLHGKAVNQNLYKNSVHDRFDDNKSRLNKERMNK